MRGFVSLVCLAAAVAAALPWATTGQNYTLTVDQSSVLVGQSADANRQVTVSWNGTCQPQEDFTGCYDWIAPFIVGACNGTDAMGANTCYAEDQWAWVSDQSSNSWTLQFTAPGVYEFRISYCGCDTCNMITDDFAECSSYNSYGTSPSFVVQPPIDLSPYTTFEQVAIGFIWYELEQATEALESMLSGSSPSCNSGCVCEAEQARTDIESAYNDFMAVCESFSMTGVKKCVGDIGDSVKDLKAVFVDCGLDEVAGKDLTEEIMEALGGFITGIGEVEDAVKMVLDGTSIYTDVANAVEAWDNGDAFATGVNAAKLVNIALSSLDATNAAAAVTRGSVDPSFFVAQAEAAADPKLGTLRHPGGAWTSCKLRSSSLCRKW